MMSPTYKYIIGHIISNVKLNIFPLTLGLNIRSVIRVVDNR